VAQTLFEHEPVASTDSEGHWIVAYEGATYVAMLDLARYESLQRIFRRRRDRRSPHRAIATRTEARLRPSTAQTDGAEIILGADVFSIQSR